MNTYTQKNLSWIRHEKICANTGRVQLRIDHPSGKTLFGSVVGSDIENRMEPAPITHASTDMKYSPNRSETPTSKLCEKEATETSSSNIHMEKLAKVSKFLPSRRSEQANIREKISFRYQNDPAPDEIDDAMQLQVK